MAHLVVASQAHAERSGRQDSDLLALVPQPCFAVLLLFPISTASEAFKAAQEAKLAASGQQISERLVFMTQTISNACGTIGLVHAALNTASLLPPVPNSFVENFGAACTGKCAPSPPPSLFSCRSRRLACTYHRRSPAERAALLEADPALDEAHGAAAVLGQSAQPDEVNLHFVRGGMRRAGERGATPATLLPSSRTRFPAKPQVCFVHVDGGLYELDGRKPFPVRHGDTSQATLLADAAKVVQTNFMDVDPTALNFSIVALATSEE